MSTEELAAAYKNGLATQLGELILRLNPYTNKLIKDSAQSTGEMELYFDKTKQPSALTANVGLEMEGPYRQEWTFKGQPQKVGMAARIKYRYPVKNGKEVLFWVEDYLLIGFQGSMGG